jgi:Protein phosphatase 2C
VKHDNKESRSRDTWRVVAAKTEGTSHRRVGKGCEDHFDSLLLSDYIHVLAVADGAGSATRAAAGARVVVAASLEAARQTLAGGSQPDSEDGWNSLLHSILRAVRVALEAKTTSSLGLFPGEVLEDLETYPLYVAVPLRDFAATLLLSIISPAWIALLQVGDGMIVLETGRQEYWCPIPPSDDGQYVNDTHFITDSNYQEFARYRSLPAVNVHGVALLTDGLQLLASNTATHDPHPPFFRPLFAFASQSNASNEELEAFLDSDRVCQRTDDDKTLVLAVRT